MKMTLDNYIKDYATLGYSIKEFYADGQKVEAVLHNEVLYLPYSYPPKTIMVDIVKVVEEGKKKDTKFYLTKLNPDEVVYYQEGKVTFAIELDGKDMHVAASFAHPNDEYNEETGMSRALCNLEEADLLQRTAPDSYLRSKTYVKHLKMLKKLAKHNRANLVLQ